MKFAIYRRKGLGYRSTIGIQKTLKEKHGRDIDVVRSDRIPKTNYDCVIRWGCTANFNRAGIVINTPKMIHDVGNKIACRMLLMKEGVSIPATFFSKAEISDMLHEGAEVRWPLIGREANHSQGTNMKVINNINELRRDNTSAYWSEYINKEREFRVYVFFGRIIKIDEKIPTEEGKTRIAWNHAGGGSVFKNVRWNEWPIEMCKEAVKAAEAIGIDFAGVDVITKDNKPYILELNSAHTMDTEYGKTVFARALNWLIKEIEKTGNKPEHFEYPTRIRGYKAFILPEVENPDGIEE